MQRLTKYPAKREAVFCQLDTFLRNMPAATRPRNRVVTTSVLNGAQPPTMRVCRNKPELNKANDNGFLADI